MTSSTKWSERLVGSADPGQALAPLVLGHLENQRREWPALRDGHAALSMLRTRRLVADGTHVVVQCNPGRVRSTTARTDAASIAARPCFLCPDNMPREEKGLSWGEFALCPNPFPVLENHVTVPSRTHEPQCLTGKIAAFFALTGDLGSEFAVLYNGPRSGASAPDHFHFQACSSRSLPVFDLPMAVTQRGNVAASRSFGRSLVTFRSTHAKAAASSLDRAIKALARQQGGGGEPMFNVIATHRDGCFLTCFFPRSRHRPRCYDAPGDACVTISPAALEMAGIVVLADPLHFDRATEDVVRTAFEEVCLAPPEFSRFLEDLA